MSPADNIAPEFDRYAASYTELLDDPMRSRFALNPLHFHRRKWATMQTMLQRAGLDSATQRWLDVGCGRGELLQLAAPHFAQAMGCDPSAEMISTAHGFRMEHQSSPTELPFDSGSVDLVTAVCVFHHVHGSARLLLAEEIRRVLAPGGLCCVIEHNPWNPVTQAIVRRCPVDADAELLTARRAGTLLRRAGLEALAVNYFLYFPEKLFRRAGRMETVLRTIPLGGQYALLARSPA